MGKPKAPSPPDPIKTAEGQTSTNVATAIANANLNNVNQVTPEGSLSFDQTDTFSFTDPVTGKTFDIPRYTATQELSPEQQNIFNQTQGAQSNLAGLAQDQSGRLQSLLGTNVDLNNEDVEQRLFDLGSRRLDPRFNEQEEALRTRLSNQGIQAGSTAFDREFRNFNEGKNDAFNNLLLQGRGQSVQEILAERNQPINEITALLSGSQVSQPNFINSPRNDIPTTDYAGIVNQDFQNRMGIYGNKMNNFNSTVGGLGGALGGLFALSDERTKKNKKKIGKIKGHDVHEFHYNDEHDDAPKHIGLMAQEVEKTKPEAVHNLYGIKMVDYAAALGDDDVAA